MIYAVGYEIEGLTGPGGYVSASQADVIDQCKVLVQNSLLIFGDSLDAEWLDIDEKAVNPIDIFQTGSIDQKLHILSQVSDELKGQKKGYIDYQEYDDVFGFVSDQNALSWCANSTKEKIVQLRNNYMTLIQDLSEEWESS
jgi:hypothetical protein